MNETKLHIETFVERSFGENGYVVHAAADDGRRVGWIVDPSFEPQPREMLDYVEHHGIHIEAVLLTHGHLDHVAGLDVVHRAAPKADVLIAETDAPMLHDANLNLSAPFGMPMTVETAATGDLAPGDTLRLGASEWLILDTSGHSPGGRSLYCAAAGAIIVGDALFAGSIGRTDLPGSDHRGLIERLRKHVLTLPGETVVYSGHGPTTTIDKERKFNPYLSETEAG